MTTISPELREALAAVDAATTSIELMSATADLVRCHELGAVPKLLEVIGYNNPALAGLAVGGLVALGPAASPLILEKLDPNNYGARAWAVRALADIGDACALEMLIQTLGQDIGPSVRRAAAKGLGKLQLSAELSRAKTQEDQCIRALVLAQHDREWAVRYAVIVSLERRLLDPACPQSPRATGRQALQNLADDDQEDVKVVRLRAELALHRLTDG